MLEIEVCQENCVKITSDYKPAQLAIKHGLLYINAIASGPYAFAFRDNRYIFVAECISKCDDAYLKSVGVKLLRDKEGCSAPSSDMHSVVAIDLHEDEIILYTGLGCRRPLFYRIDQDRVAVSSHVRGELRVFGKLQISKDSLAELFVYRYITPPSTVFDNVKEMIGGEIIRLSLRDFGKFSSTIKHLPVSGGTKEFLPAEAQCYSLLESSISNGTSRFRRPAVLFSGGLDSTLIAVACRSICPEIPLYSSSYRFVDSDDEETHYATTAATALKLPLYVHEGTIESYLRGLIHSVMAAEEPLHHLQSVMLHQLFNDPRVVQHDVLLSGEAADSLFGNAIANQYQKHRSLIELSQKLHLASIGKSIAKLLSTLDRRFEFFTNDFGVNHSSDGNLLWSLGKYSNEQLIRSVFGLSTESILVNKREVLSDFRGRDFLDQINVLSLRAEAFKSMTIWSKIAEASGMALHYPFTDDRLMSFVMSLPWNEKCTEPKAFVRQMLRTAGIPEELIKRPKLGFGLPAKYWAVPNAMFQPIVDMAEDYFGRGLLTKLQVDHEPSAMALWNAINLFIVKRLFVDETSANSMALEIIDRHRHIMRSRNISSSVANFA